MNRAARARGLAAAVLTAVVLAAGAGCTAEPPPTSTPTAPATPSPTSSPVVQITFDDGTLLDPSQAASWADPLADTDGYTVVTADDGDGSWSYRQDDTGCVIGYWHGDLAEADAAAGDSALSDELLAVQFGSPVGEIAPFVDDDIAPFRTPSQLVQTRAVAGADDHGGTTYIIAARAFAALGEGFVATLECPADTNVVDAWTLLSANPDTFELVFATG